MFRHHPDGRIYLGALVLSLAEFLDFEPGYALPAGVIGRTYVPSDRHHLTDGQTQTGGPLPWADGDGYLAAAAAGDYDPPEPTDAELLVVAVSAKHAEITAARDAAISVGIEYGGNIYDADSRSQANLTATVTAVNAGVPLPEGFVWRTSDNQNVPMDVATLAGLAAVMLAQGNAAYQRSWELKAQLDLAATVESVAQIAW